MYALLRDKARELLASGAVHCVIGYERGTDGVNARPAFVYQPGDVDRLVFDQTCTHDLVRYLLNKKAKPTAIVAKPCDARAVNLLLGEKQIARERVYVLGVVCPGMVEVGFGRKGDQIQARCRACTEHTPVLFDFLAGEPRPETPAQPYPGLAELEGKSAAERDAFWQGQWSHCIRCYACRQVCPGCYCTECFVDRIDPEWVGLRVAPAQNAMWNTIRAFHLAGRCIGCNECSRVCPMGLPLDLANRKLAGEVQELFDYQAGGSHEALAPLATFLKDELPGAGDPGC